MKLLGYILTFAIMIASIILLVVAVAVYGTQKNWQTAFNALQQKSQAAQVAAADAESKYLDQISRLKAEQDAARQDVARLETEPTRSPARTLASPSSSSRLSSNAAKMKLSSPPPRKITSV